MRKFDVAAKYDDVNTALMAPSREYRNRAIGHPDQSRPLGYEVRAEIFGSGDGVAVGLDANTPLRSVEPEVPPSEERAYANARTPTSRCASRSLSG